MQNLYTHQDKNVRKTWFLFTIFLIIVVGLGYYLSVYYGSPEILYIAVAFAVFQSVLSFWFSHKIVLSMSGAKPVVREDSRELWNIVENLSRKLELIVEAVEFIRKKVDTMTSSMGVVSSLASKMVEKLFFGKLTKEFDAMVDEPPSKKTKKRTSRKKK